VEILSLDEFHYEKMGACILADIMQSDDVRVIEGGRRPGLPHETLQCQLINSLLGRKYFQGHTSVKAQVFAQAHNPHPTLADRTENLVRSEYKSTESACQDLPCLKLGQQTRLDKNICTLSRITRQLVLVREFFREPLFIKNPTFLDQAEEVAN
jgi:hypothetical protein